LGSVNERHESWKNRVRHKARNKLADGNKN
jgi:hypothetical protein